MLPEEFKQRMQNMLGTEYAAFEESFGREAYHALRLNPFKTAQEEFLQKTEFSLQPVPWAENGFYYRAGDAPGKHPYHEAGVYYIQEPSAMAPAEYLDAAPGERILDLCAAPGGKSTQIAAKMQGRGLLICNEIHPGRAKILSENIERMGVCNAVVTNEAPERLAERFPGFFDKILVDAPCSGEGMFRKNREAITEWSLEHVKQCAKRQDAVLLSAAEMLRPGGKLVYSTCTFAPEENEGTIGRFLKRSPEFSILHAERTEGMSEGRPEWAGEDESRIKETIRLFPHKLCGEGHYLALLQKEGGAPGNRPGPGSGFRGVPEKACKLWQEFARENLKSRPEGEYLFFGDRLCLLPKDAPGLDGIKVLRAGLHLGCNKKNRFEPSHALALFLSRNMACRTIDLPSGGQTIRRYLNGESFPADGETGWYLVTTDGYGIGWGKLAGGMIKNHYPKGLRKSPNAFLPPR